MEEPRPTRAAVEPLLRVRQARAFTDAAVDASALDAIADAARWSGSRANRQPWRFIVVSRAEVVRRIGEAGAPDAGTLATAPAAVAIVLPQEQGAAISNAFDEGRAAERMLIAAELLGMGAGIAWIASEGRPAVGELLGVPDGWFVRTMVAIGHPAERAATATGGRSRLPREETVLSERWGG
jgi:nitroreductase